MADTGTAAEPVFRASKRRKVFRKRADSGDREEDRDIHKGVRGGEAARGIDSSEDREDGVLRTQKRAGARKHGIAFSSTEGRRTAEQGSEEQALVPFNQDAPPDAQIDRFVRPMGREAVSEDKHMMAYVDSKLAEMRTAAAPATANDPDGPDKQDSTTSSHAGAIATLPTTSDERTSHSAQARSDRVYQRPTKRPRKKKYERGEADIARDAYIDQFMQEAQVPIYDQSTTKNASLDTDGDGDNDAATAEAFKAQLLADMAMHRRRPPKSASAQAATASSGPKLGGSRQQRERMRAMQEAEGKK